jgi:hypothetical protein
MPIFFCREYLTSFAIRVLQYPKRWDKKRKKKNPYFLERYWLEQKGKIPYTNSINYSQPSSVIKYPLTRRDGVPLAHFCRFLTVLEDIFRWAGNFRWLLHCAPCTVYRIFLTNFYVTLVLKCSCFSCKNLLMISF